MEFQEEEDCTVYIEELKTDDPNLKINAVSKISTISDILGPTRTREELLPYLIEIIEECDNEDEFLIKLAEQILNLKSKLGGKEHSHLLIAPLEILSSMEEQTVRSKAVDCLIELALNQSPQFFSTNFFQMVKQLAAWENYPSRISACQLIKTCYKQLQPNEQLELRLLFAELGHDDTPMVRRSTAENIPNLAEISNKDVIKKDIVPLWQLLMKDEIDSVKIRAIEATPSILSRLSLQESEEIFMPVIQLPDLSKSQSWRVRYTLAEILPQLTNYLEKKSIQNEIFNIYEQLMNDTEQEVKSIAILQLPQLLEKIVKDQIIEKILPTLKNAAGDTSHHVRVSVAQILSKVSRFLDVFFFFYNKIFSKVQIIIDEIFPLLEKLFKDEIVDVKLAVIENFNLFQNLLGLDNTKTYLIPLINSTSLEKNWRARLSVIEQLPKLCEKIPLTLFQDSLVPFCNSFFNDHYFTIRKQIAENYKKFKEIYGYKAIRSGIFGAIQQLISNTNYLYRVTALITIGELSDTLESFDLNELFLQCIQGLADDKVANVRFNLAKTFSQIMDKLPEGTKKKMQMKLKQYLIDKDMDVQFYSKQALDKF